MPTEDSLRFVPSAVEGLPGVTEAVVFPDRLELLSGGQWVVIRFGDIARPYSGDLEDRPSVADRDWFHPPAGRFVLPDRHEPQQRRHDKLAIIAGA